MEIVKNADIPKLIKTREDDCKKYDSYPLVMQEEIEKIQGILKDQSFEFLKKVKNNNQVIPSALKSIFVYIYCECEKIAKLSWYSQGEGVGNFEKLIRLIREKTKNKEIDGVSNTSITDWLKKSTKPQYEENKRFMNFMKEQLGSGSHKISFINLKMLINRYENLQ